ncbi:MULTISPECIES: transcription termination factor NusA [Psychrilyobacter]|uniref:Transcription termination/antitermination protein NusA n=1 Tax=Psychrilyobacter piezotolerans TaxID=2293438 RepID=A0ABX9KF48_9FUSO|nr:MULTISPECIES: transcription termination factor NusA [Psychrilyobacter]MCS5421587.1 transcription termination factor NusA [Psychrilyobacter sp. S5]NDI78567.1 transcription termination/antitermination protein NusA [Psychrilyobacter piezotolerans]RDE60272.1 transcription termination/antitermination protein NusA [Psychrilyobacter sp. S5]REI40380.1 transcription termination/antitermination protein NusA [Psychrilyobacter piezotolerans]
MTKKDFKIFLEALDELEKEKGISKEELIETIEQAILAAYKKNYGEYDNLSVRIDEKKAKIIIFVPKTVVTNVEDDELEIELSEAQLIPGKKRAKIGDVVEIEENCEEFKRNAIQNGKQIVIQKVREAERQHLYDNFKENEHEMLNGIIRRIDERRNIHIEFDMKEAVLAIQEQSPADLYRVGDRLKVYVSEVEKTNKYPKIIITRKHDDFLRKLFELEVPEIEEGIIELKSVVREAGSRAKVAVYSDNTDIDTVGACIGQRGLRIKNIVNELNGEKIDIIEWKADKKEFVKAALSPAKVESVEILDDDETARVIVEKSQLSLAIGKAGQNARLAAKLTGMRVDIKTLEDVMAAKEEAKLSEELSLEETVEGENE